MATAKTQDFSNVMQEMMNAFPVDTKAFEAQYEKAADLNEKLSAVAIDAAGRTTELSTKFAKDTLSRLADMSKAKSEPADYAKAMSDFAQAQAELSSEQMSAFAEIVKDAQSRTLELVMAAGREMGEDAAKTTKAAASKAGTAAQKASTTK